MRTIHMSPRTRAVGRVGSRNLFGTLLQVWLERRRQRTMLARLDAHLLDDIGLSGEDVAREIAKPFWRP
ncbi:DUF1127 domain-containing protein [Arenibaculum sp.]|uniref:DUF1127 domain-containing protein n=1 Tax=Arenibaculum sp. TaxID=2865862 RepID=UPI002E11588D|nr:DUF1127 domain-containing protein [Arenibaculum sp.]